MLYKAAILSSVCSLWILHLLQYHSPTSVSQPHNYSRQCKEKKKGKNIAQDVISLTGVVVARSETVMWWICSVLKHQALKVLQQQWVLMLLLPWSNCRVILYTLQFCFATVCRLLAWKVVVAMAWHNIDKFLASLLSQSCQITVMLVPAGVWDSTVRRFTTWAAK